MGRKFTINIVTVLFLAIANHSNIQAQCTFTGLNPQYCVNSPTSALSTTATGGWFTGAGVSGTAFSPSVAGPGTHTISYGVCASNYTVTSGTFSPIATPTSGPGAPAHVFLSDDQVSGNLPIGFTFQFFCQPYTDFYISSNGFITFSAGQPNGCCTGQTLPDPNTPNNLIAFGWEDFNPGSGGSITYTTVGTAPNRVLVMKFDQVPHFGGSGGPLTCQVQLYESTNVIEIHTASMQTDGGNHTMGIENLNGNIAVVVPGRNASASWSASNEMYRFTMLPSCISSQTTVVSPSTINIVGSSSLCTGNSVTLTATGNTSYTWTSPASNASSIVVSPGSTTNYSVSGTNAFGCVANAAITVTVFSGLPVLSVSSSTNSTCLGRTVTLTASGAVTYTWTNGVVNGQSFAPTSTTTYTVLGQNACGTSSAATTISVDPIPISVLASPSLVCQGFPSTLTAVSGVTGYTWAPFGFPSPTVVATPTSNSIYTVSVSDGTCSGTATVEVQTKTTPTITASASSTNICEGEAVTLSASGAGAGGTYTWTPSGSNLSTFTISPPASTLFIVSATNSLNCESSAQQVVVVQAAPAIQITASSTLVCIGNSITLTGTGGATAYNWIGGPSTSVNIVSPTGPAVYTLTGTHQTNSCVATRTIATSAIVPNVTVPASIGVCTGLSGTITASGATTYSFNGVNTGTNGNFVVAPQTTTSYTFIAITQNTVGTFLNCPTTHTVLVNVNPNPTVTVVATKSLICRGTSNTLTANGAVNYDWGTAGTGSVVVVSPTVPTVYTVIGTDANGCEHTVLFQTNVSSCVGLAENEKVLQNISVFPNPSKGEFIIKLDSDIDLQLINQLGQEIKHIQVNGANNYQVTVKGLSKGVYFLIGENQNGKVNQKIVITD